MASSNNVIEDNPNFSLNDLSSASGIFYEKLGEIHYYDQTWKLITYLNISYLSYRQKLINRYDEKIDKICKSSGNSIACNKMLPILSDRILVLHSAYENLLNLVGHKKSEKARVKRGILNIIGSGLKVLVGTMDNNDAEYIQNAINNLEEEQKESLTILQDQTTILSNTVNNFNESIINLQKMETQINKVIKEINLLTNQIQNELNQTLLEQHVIQLVNLLNALIVNTDIDLNNLINTIMFTKIGQIHPLIIPFRIFLAKLIEGQEQLPVGLTFPVTLKEENIHLILKISEITSYLQGNILVFIIKVPITEQETFELYNMIPIPQKANLLAPTVMINPRRKYLIISKTRDKFVLTDNVAKQCKDIDFGKICNSLTFVNSYTNAVCETELFIVNKMLNCDLRMVANDIEIWHKLEKHNSWLYTITRSTVLTINCEHSTDIKISGTGSLTIKNNQCKGSTIYHSLIPDLGLKSTFENKIVNKDLSEDNCCIEENLKVVTNLQLVSTVKITNVNLKELSETAHRIKILKGRISEILSTPNPLYQFSILSYTTGVIILIMFIFICWKLSKGGKVCFKLCCFNRWFCKRDTNTVPMVTYTEGPKSLRRRRIESTRSETSTSTKDSEYRFDL